MHVHTTEIQTHVATLSNCVHTHTTYTHTTHLEPWIAGADTGFSKRGGCRGGYRVFQKVGLRPAIRNAGGGCYPFKARYEKRGGGGGGGAVLSI